jgi:hypothetical protein
MKKDHNNFKIKNFINTKLNKERWFKKKQVES